MSFLRCKNHSSSCLINNKIDVLQIVKTGFDYCAYFRYNISTKVGDGYNAHRLTANGRCKVYTVKKDLLEIGKVFVRDNCGNEIPMYDLERTICDLVRSRSTIDIQEFLPALKAYAARKDKDLNKLWEYSRLFRIQSVVRKYMQVLL